MLIPVANVHAAISGTPTLGAVDAVPTPTTYTQSSASINITAGGNAVSAINGVAHTGLFAINFTGVTFSGAQFYLTMSPDGLNNINTSAGDVRYAGPFTKSNFASASCAGTLCREVFGGNDYYIGTTSGGVPVIEGPIPVNISSLFNYIKVYDGSCGTNPAFCGAGVAVAAGFVQVQPGLTLKYYSGYAGMLETVYGGGFPLNTLINMNYSFTYTSFANPVVYTPMVGNWTGMIGINTGRGYFSQSASMIDTKQVINPPTLVPILSVNILFTATHYNGASTVVYANTTFAEDSRFISEVLALDSSGHPLSTSNPLESGVAWANFNGSATGTCDGVTVCPLNTQDAVSNGTLIIAGNESLVNSAVTFFVGSTQYGGAFTSIGSVTSNAAGNFNGTATLPALSIGLHLVEVRNNGVIYWFQIFIEPSLVLTPSSGPVHTVVKVTGYGFPAGANIYLYWYEISYDGIYYNLNTTSGALINITVPSDGHFSGIQFYALHSWGGYHEVVASTGFVRDPDYIPVVEVASTSFDVTPQIAISPTSINSNVKGWLNVTGTGFNPEEAYYVSIDNALFGAGYPGFVSAENGDFYVNFTSTGYQPGWHQVEVFPNCDWYSYSCSSFYGHFAPVAYTFFNVTTIGAYTGGGSGGLPASVITEITNINNNVNTILGWQSTIYGMNTNIGTISSNVGTILGWGPTITDINTHVTTILGWQSTIIDINSTVNGLKATLVTMGGTLTTIINGITSATTAANAAKTSADAASTAATNAKSSVSDTETYVLVVAVLAAITLVLELAILVRKLD
ncbi:MAG: hypothetical protein ABSB26_03210 [Nitrososphaerales archaeon]